MDGVDESSVSPRLMRDSGAAQFYLASASPRRSRLLADVGLRFEILLTDIDETKRESEACEDYVLRMAEEKENLR